MAGRRTGPSIKGRGVIRGLDRPTPISLFLFRLSAEEFSLNSVGEGALNDRTRGGRSKRKSSRDCRMGLGGHEPY
jgi:hypothetical protein